MTTGKTIPLTIPNFVGEVMSLFFNILPRFVIVFSAKEQESFNFMAAVTDRDFGAEENKTLSLFPLFPYLCVMK